MDESGAVRPCRYSTANREIWERTVREGRAGSWVQCGREWREVRE